jgi:hypothetical protein
MKNLDQAGTPYVLPQPGSSVPDSQFAFVLSGRLLDGTPLTPPGEPNNVVSYVNPGDPVEQTGWLATQDYGGATDCKILLGSGPCEFPPGGSIRFVVAFLVAQGTDRLNSIQKLKEAVPVVVDKWNSLITTVGESRHGPIPGTHRLHQNYPNPFNPSTTIEYALHHSGYVTLRVYNVLGEELATLVDGEQSAGPFTTEWDASDMPSGIYFYRLRAGNYVQTRKMVLMK